MNRLVLSMIMLGLGVVMPAVQAESIGEDYGRSLAPRLWIADGDPKTDRLPLKSSRAKVRINGPIVEVVVTQRYQNMGSRPINARYVFPGSTQAAVHGLVMQTGGRRISAKIKEKAEAKQIFEQAKSEGKRAALLEQQRPNVFMMDTANIMPGDDIELELTYSELLVPEDGVYQFVYPTVVGPRYGSDPLQVAADAAWLANPYAPDDPGANNPAAVETAVEVSLDSPVAIKDFQAVQHKVHADWHNAKSADIRLDAGETQAGNRDFILRFRLQDDRILSGLMTYRQGDENYFLATVQPPQRVAPATVLRREYVFVVDVSGSMAGFPLDTSTALMHELLAGLKPHETFNILFFAGDARVLSPTPLPATPENIQRAFVGMQNYQGGGGTELISALDAAYAMPKTEDIARSIVVLTDGYINAERDAFDLIAQHLNSTNVFAFGIGSSVNRYLIESMARAGAGEPFVVTSQAEVAEVSARFRRYVEAPLLSNIGLQGDDVELYDMEPGQLPSLLAERPVVVFGKYRGEGAAAKVVLTGMAADGGYKAELPLADAETENRAELLPVLWARHKLMRLSDWAGNQVNANKAEIIALALKYSLLSRYTSFVAVDEVVANPDGNAENVQQPLRLPKGVSELAISRAQPMPEPDLIVLALALALAAAWRTVKESRHV